jgi:hypothetical protein
MHQAEREYVVFSTTSGWSQDLWILDSINAFIGEGNYNRWQNH